MTHWILGRAAGPTDAEERVFAGPWISRQAKVEAERRTLGLAAPRAAVGDDGPGRRGPEPIMMIGLSPRGPDGLPAAARLAAAA
jgi:hypothetical protein